MTLVLRLQIVSGREYVSARTSKAVYSQQDGWIPVRFCWCGVLQVVVHEATVNVKNFTELVDPFFGFAAYINGHSQLSFIVGATVPGKSIYSGFKAHTGIGSCSFAQYAWKKVTGTYNQRHLLM